MVTPDQATRAFTLFAFSEAAKLRGQRLTILYDRPGCPDSAEAENLLKQWGILFLTCDITTDEAAQDYFRAAGYRTTPQISVGEHPIEGGLAGLKKMGPAAFSALVSALRPADEEVRDLLVSLAERASAIATRTAIALRLGVYACQGEGPSADSIHDIGDEVGNLLDVMDRLAALGAISADVLRTGAEFRRPEFGPLPGRAS